jgi:hypothetical protein
VATIDEHVGPVDTRFPVDLHPSSRPFVSLRDSAIAAPQTTYKGHLKYNIADALSPGLTVDNSGAITQGRVYVTSGNTHPGGRLHLRAGRRNLFHVVLLCEHPLGASRRFAGIDTRDRR